MGKHFCVCNDANNLENESNIFSVMPKNKGLEKETIKTLNSDNQINQNYTTKSFQEDNYTNNYYALNFLVNEMYKNNDYNNYNNYNNKNNKLLSDINKHDNFHCTGKFNALQSNQNYQIPNGGIVNNDNNSLNISDKKINNSSGKNINKNEFSFTNFKPLYDGNKNDIEIKNNKDNNTNNSIGIYNNKYNITNKSSEYNDIQKIQENNFSICKDNNNENKILINKKNDNCNDYRYNNISQYSDVSDKEYLNNESNYYNSNKREENREIGSLYYEDSHNSEE